RRCDFDRSELLSTAKHKRHVEDENGVVGCGTRPCYASSYRLISRRRKVDEVVAATVLEGDFIMSCAVGIDGATDSVGRGVRRRARDSRDDDRRAQTRAATIACHTSANDLTCDRRG